MVRYILRGFIIVVHMKEVNVRREFKYFVVNSSMNIYFFIFIPQRNIWTESLPEVL
jgi:hypothetical protein